MRVSFDIPLKEGIKDLSKGSLIGREIIFYEAVTSTNDKAIEIGEGMKNPEGVVVIADAQARGRGRFGRHWVSPPGVNLYFTVLLKPPFYPKNAPLLTLMAAVASASAIKEHAGLDVKLKWPNDILAGGRKAGGILTEMRTEAEKIIFAAIGIGLNVNMSLNMFPEDIRMFTASLMQEKGELIDRVKLLECILGKIEYWYKVLLNGDKKALINQWLLLDSTTGNKVSVQSQYGVISGLAEGIDDEGALMLRLSSGTVEKIYAGEVTVLKDTSQI